MHIGALESNKNGHKKRIIYSNTESRNKTKEKLFLMSAIMFSWVSLISTIAFTKTLINWILLVYFFTDICPKSKHDREPNVGRNTTVVKF